MNEQNPSPSEEMLLCGECGKPIPPGEHFCPKCLAAASKAVPAGQRAPLEEAPGSMASVSQGPLDRVGEQADAEAPGIPEGPPEVGLTQETEVSMEQSAELSQEEPAKETVPPVEEPSVPSTQPLMLCGNCSVELPAGAHFCPECGAPASMAVPATAPSTISAPEGAGTSQPAVSSTRPRSGPAVVPVVPKQPAIEQKPQVRWPWILLMVLGGLVSIIFFFFSCVLLGAAEDIAADGDFSLRQIQMIGLLCCLVPGILLLVGSVFGGIRAFRKPK